MISANSVLLVSSIAPLVSGSPRMGQTKNIGKPLGLVAGAKYWSARPESSGIWAGCPKGQVGRHGGPMG